MPQPTGFPQVPSRMLPAVQDSPGYSLEQKTPPLPMDLLSMLTRGISRQFDGGTPGTPTSTMGGAPAMPPATPPAIPPAQPAAPGGANIGAIIQMLQRSQAAQQPQVPARVAPLAQGASRQVPSLGETLFKQRGAQ